MLADVQGRIESHFAALAQQRASHQYPVYAIEHGLAPIDIASIRVELARTRRLQREHWLLWIAVAAEIGYEYDGDEFWISFAESIPDWRTFGDRDTIRSWFQAFASGFSGFSPGGRWARHFSIIAWPITHSILPRYLQAHFAGHLYELRYDLARPGERDIGELGDLIRDRYHGASSRFREFLQQTELTARLVLALRDEDVHDAVALVHRGTLARIVSDLEQGRSARRHLHEARRVLREARIRAATSLVRSQSTREPAGSKDRSGRIGCVKLAARCSVDGMWAVGVTLPDFTAMLGAVGLERSVLDKTRLRFIDKPERWMPGRSLLAYAQQDHVLARLPEPLIEPILSLEDPVPGLSELFASELCVQGTSPWLLRLHEDGVARQVLGNHVRTSQRYVLIVRDALPADLETDLGLQARDSVTSGLALYTMDTPSTITDRYRRALERLDFGYALRASVEAVGLTPRWDEVSGGSSWLPHEEVVFRLSADFDVAEFVVSLDGQQQIRVSLNGADDALVSLGALSVGRHFVEVAAFRDNSSAAARLATSIEPEVITLEVRPPEPWRVSVERHSGFRIVVDPPDAAIEALLANRASISIYGPNDRAAIIEARLFDANGHPLDCAELGRVMMPHTANAMRRVIEKLSTEPLSEKVHGAPRVDIVASVEELGISSLSFTQKIEPVRWKLERRDSESTIRLIDDAGLPPDVLLERLPMGTPGERIALRLDECITGIVVEPPGSLFVARYEQRLYAAIVSVPPRSRITALTHLGFEISLANVDREADSIIRLLALSKRWRVARPLGPLAAIRRAHVLEAFELAITQALCGSDWANRVRECRRGQTSLLPMLQREVGGSPGFASRMRTTDWAQVRQDVARADFARIAKHYQISDDVELCEIAFRLAFSPTRLGIDDLARKRGLLNRLVGNRPLARGAFLAKLAVDIGVAAPPENIAEATA